MVSIYCPKCGSKIDIETEIQWNTAYCKQCDTSIVVHLTNKHVYVKYNTVEAPQLL